jgi:hypothetical protein
MIDPELRETQPSVDDKMLRQFAGLWLAIFGAVAIVELWVRHRSGRALLWALVAGAIGPAGIVRPPLIKPVFTVAMAAAMPIGLVMSRVLLAILFYVVFAPVAVVFRLLHRDALVRRRPSEARTFWTDKEQPSDLRSYFRQS